MVMPSDGQWWPMMTQLWPSYDPVMPFYDLFWLVMTSYGQLLHVFTSCWDQLSPVWPTQSSLQENGYFRDYGASCNFSHLDSLEYTQLVQIQSKTLPWELFQSKCIDTVKNGHLLVFRRFWYSILLCQYTKFEKVFKAEISFRFVLIVYIFRKEGEKD